MRNTLPSCLLRVAHVVGISVVRRSFIKKRSSISNAYAEFSMQFLRLGCTVCEVDHWWVCTDPEGSRAHPVCDWIWASVNRNVLLPAGKVSLPFILIQSQQLIRASTNKKLIHRKTDLDTVASTQLNTSLSASHWACLQLGNRIKSQNSLG